MDKESRNHRRRFGQNFLIDTEVIENILSDLPSRPGWVIEIGPGGGALTKGLRLLTNELTLIELDPIVALKLKDRWTDNVPTVRQEDASQTPIMELLTTNTKKPWVIGNLPYNMAGPILRHWVPFLPHMQGMHAMVQYEVARRICAAPGGSDYGYLSAWMQNLARPRLLRKIAPDAFRPRPNVHSATIELVAREPIDTSEEFNIFLQQCFAQKRKQLTNNLKTFYPREALREVLKKEKFTDECRAEELGVEALARIYQLVEDLAIQAK